MEYKIVLIEDDEYSYKKLQEKLQHSSYNDFRLVQSISWITSQTEYKKYLTDLIAIKASIYIVDWQLQFADGLKFPSDILKDLAENGFKSHEKYWIFYSQDFDYDQDARAYILEHFAGKDNNDSPGKSNILKPIVANRPDFLKICLNRAVTFLQINKPQKPEGIIIKEKARFYNTEAPMPFEWRSRDEFIQVVPEKAICMAAVGKWGVLIFESENKINVYIVNLSDCKQTIVEKLPFTLSSRFHYNPRYFDENIQLLNTYHEAVWRKTALLKDIFTYIKPSGQKSKKIIPQLGQLKRHGVRP